MSMRSATFRSRSISTRTRAKGSKYFSEEDPNAPVQSVRRFPSLEEVDLIEKRDALIWNTPWKEQLDYKDGLEKQRREEETYSLEKQTERSSKGFLSLASSSAYAEYSTSKPNTISKESSLSQRKNLSNASSVRVEEENVERYERKDKDSNSSVPYEQLKMELMLGTILVGVLLSSACGWTYGLDVGASVGLGALASVMYVRMLVTSVDSTSGFGSVISQPRLLVPAILVAAINRWNELAADTYDVHLALLPALIGFFVYKAVAVGQLLRDILALSTQEKS